MTAQTSAHPQSAPALILGASGKIGRRVAAKLAAQGRALRCASRQGDTRFDWTNQDGWDAALTGVRDVFISYAPDLAVPGATDAVAAFVEKARTAGVRRLVLLSGRGEAEAQAAERLVQESGREWTIVRASWFNQNFSEGAFLPMVLAGEIALPAGDVPEPFVDADDIADVAAAALTEDGHQGEIYEVTGPRLLTLAEAAAEIAAAAGREVRFAALSQDAFSQGLSAAGLPHEYAWLLDYLFDTVLDGRNAYLADGVRRAIGRAPKDFSQYARETAATGLWRAAA